GGPALGRAPHVRLGEGGAGGHGLSAGALHPPYAPEGLRARWARWEGSPLRAHRHRRGAGPPSDRSAGQDRVPRRLQLRVGEALASGDRGARGRDRAVRDGGGGIPARRGSGGPLVESISRDARPGPARLRAVPSRGFTRVSPCIATLALWCLGFQLGAVAAQSPVAATPTVARLRVYSLRAEALEQARQLLATGDTALRPAYERLVREADVALKAGPFSVTDKRRTPPSGDKHDYVSMAPYWWYDSSKPNGLPYLRRDGERNPEINKITDHKNLDNLENATTSLSLAWYFTGEEKYSKKAADLLRYWFFNEATKMNSNLEYAQGIPGINNGRGIG